MHPLVICYFYKHLIIIHVGNWIPVQCSKHLSSTHQLHHVFWQGQGQSQLHPITDRGKVSYIHHWQGQWQSQLHPITDRDRGKVSYIPSQTETGAKSATSQLWQGQWQSQLHPVLDRGKEETLLVMHAGTRKQVFSPFHSLFIFSPFAFLSNLFCSHPNCLKRSFVVDNEQG